MNGKYAMNYIHKIKWFNSRNGDSDILCFLCFACSPWSHSHHEEREKERVDSVSKSEGMKTRYQIMDIVNQGMNALILRVRNHIQCALAMHHFQKINEFKMRELESLQNQRHRKMVNFAIDKRQNID